MDTKNKGFHRGSKRGVREIKGCGVRKLPTRASTLQEVRNSSYLGLLSIFGPRQKGFLFKGLFEEEKLGFRVLLYVSSPRRRCESSHGRLVLC